MIDLHSHILPGLDDGAADWEESVAMCGLAAADGIQLMAATPHYYPGVAPLELTVLECKLQELRDHLTQAEVQLELVSGAEVALDPSLVQLAKAGSLPTLGTQGRYFLLELPPMSPTLGLEELVFQLQLNGLTPILSHPERTWSASRDWAWLQRLVRSGCLVQVTANSITGQFGAEVQATTTRLLELSCCHLVASDAHSRTWRPPVLSKARAALERLVGPDGAHLLLEDGPRAVLEGREPEPISISKKRGRRWFKLGPR